MSDKVVLTGPRDLVGGVVLVIGSKIMHRQTWDKIIKILAARERAGRGVED